MKQSMVIFMLSLIIAACPVQFLYAHSGGGDKGGGRKEGRRGECTRSDREFDAMEHGVTPSK